ncbi:transglutaminase-like domain-containing protein [Ornithinibacillus halophilus]|uniref:Transglutaminase-like superfamily protein n=1 Tax=Ornithinibacillus halophilus TaxID=930117 RepID=A0A1M5FVT8_9BACI|nr:transglutaminase domain-containing protein [Ornithinibacillus halophilus]SHF95680.1 Transglutaminase-like superfamily protein [Ornithinibacillus halophilus]
MNRTVNVDYKYHNTICEKMNLWMILPSSTMDYRSDVIEPKQVHTLLSDEKMAYFELEEGQTLHVNYDAQEYKADKELSLSEEKRKYYLRDTTLSPVNKEIRELALDIVKTEQRTVEKARAIFHYIVSNFKYVYPPQSRGVYPFLKTMEGDCGEFSFLFTSLCRSLQIPARTVVGSWANGKMNGHVWNEYFIEGEGWIPVDSSMARLTRRNIFKFIDSDIRTLNWRKYFGYTEGQRVVFAKDADMELIPSFQEEKNEKVFYNMEAMYINDEAFYWGQQSLHENAPYLQPVYVQLDSNEEFQQQKLTTTDLLGFWQIRELGTSHILSRLKIFSIVLGLIALPIAFIFDNMYAEILYKGFFIIFFISSILRRERIGIFSFLLLLMIMSLLSSVSS